MTILGIDLGTTNSACAIWRDGKSELIPNRFGDFLTPSVVGLDDNGELLVGKFAKQRLLSHPQLCASVFKRYMGTDNQQTLGKKSFTSPELSALVLKSCWISFAGPVAARKPGVFVVVAGSVPGRCCNAARSHH